MFNSASGRGFSWTISIKFSVDAVEILPKI